MKKLILFLLCLTTILCGCGKSDAVPESTTEVITTEAVVEPTPASETPIVAESSQPWTLFETCFLPIAEGKVGVTQTAVTNFLTQLGFEWSLDEGQFSVLDPEHPGSYLSGDLTTIHEEIELANLSYHFIIAEALHATDVVQRAAKVVFVGDNAGFYIALDWLGDGTKVETLQEVVDYMMTSALRPEETPMGVYATRMTKVLSGEVGYTSTDDIEGMPTFATLSEYLEYFPVPASFAKVSAADMDGDGFNEIVLSVVQPEHEEETGGLVLHYQDGMIFGRTYYHRQLNSLKADGTFSWSGSASHNGTGTLVFDDYDPYAPLSEYTWNLQEIHMCDVGEFGSGTYLVGGYEATEDEFCQAMDEQEKKEDARWLNYPSSDYSALF